MLLDIECRCLYIYLPSADGNKPRRKASKLFDPAFNQFYSPEPSIISKYRENCFASENSAPQIKFENSFSAHNEVRNRLVLEILHERFHSIV